MKNNIPFFDLIKQYKSFKNEINKVICEVCDAAAFSDGIYVRQFEKKFAQFTDVKYAIGLNNGTSALHLAMRALNIGPGDQVIVPANTFIATAWAVSYVGATPIFVDCDPDTWNIDTVKTEKKIGPKMVGKKYRIAIVEDCAQAHGAKYKGKRVGGLAEMGCFSFYPSKNLGAYGEAGAVTTNKKTYADRIMKLKDHGAAIKYYHDEVGFNMRMDGIQAAILNFKLKYLNAWNKRRRQIADLYLAEIQNHKIKIQAHPQWAESVYHLFVITTTQRDKLRSYLSFSHIDTSLHYPIPCHLQKAYKHLGYKRGSCPNAEYLASHCLSLPMYPELTDKEVRVIINTINKY